jgi:hypothetical protein
VGQVQLLVSRARREITRVNAEKGAARAELRYAEYQGELRRLISIMMVRRRCEFDHRLREFKSDELARRGVGA